MSQDQNTYSGFSTSLVDQLAGRLQSILLDLIHSIRLSPRTSIDKLDLGQHGVYLLYSDAGVLLNIVVIEQGTTTAQKRNISWTVGHLVETGLATSFRRLDSPAAGLTGHLALLLGNAVEGPVDGVIETTHTLGSVPVANTTETQQKRRPGQPQSMPVGAVGNVEG